jgi:hypothetical protein
MERQETETMSANGEQGKPDPEAPLVRKAIAGDAEAL